MVLHEPIQTSKTIQKTVVSSHTDMCLWSKESSKSLMRKEEYFK